MFALCWLLGSDALSSDACSSGTHVTVGNNTYQTKVLVVKPGAAGSESVLHPNTNVSAVVIGALESDGSIFWKSDGDFDYVYGANPRQLIIGFDVGSFNMTLGETRMICIPPTEGYGDESKPGIPPNSTLVFTLNCDKIEVNLPLINLFYFSILSCYP